MSGNDTRVRELRAELKDLFTKAAEIEKPYGPGNPITNLGDQESMSALLEQVSTKEAQLQDIQGAADASNRIAAGLASYAEPTATGGFMPPWQQDSAQFKSLGDIFIESEGYIEAERKGLFQSRSVPEFGEMIQGRDLLDPGSYQSKTLVYAGGATTGQILIQPERRPGFLETLYPARTFTDIVPRSPTSAEVIEFVREDTFTNNAVEIAEASVTSGETGLKPESAISFDEDSVTVRDLAHWIPVTNKMLRDAPGIRGIIDQRLLLGLQLRVEAQLITGDGSAPNLKGLLEYSIQLQAKGSDSIVDAIHKAVTKVRVTGLTEPNFILMNPLDWETVRLSRENAATATLGGYLYGPPATAGVTSVWGIPVTLTTSLAQGTAIVGDFRQCTLFDRMRSVVRTGLVNDQFIRNMQTILAEMALAFVVWRPNAFCQVTGL